MIIGIISAFALDVLTEGSVVLFTWFLLVVYIEILRIWRPFLSGLMGITGLWLIYMYFIITGAFTNTWGNKSQGNYIMSSGITFWILMAIVSLFASGTVAIFKRLVGITPPTPPSTLT